MANIATRCFRRWTTHVAPPTVSVSGVRRPFTAVPSARASAVRWRPRLHRHVSSHRSRRLATTRLVHARSSRRSPLVWRPRIASPGRRFSTATARLFTRPGMSLTALRRTTSAPLRRRAIRSSGVGNRLETGRRLEQRPSLSLIRCQRRHPFLFSTDGHGTMSFSQHSTGEKEEEEEWAGDRSCTNLPDKSRDWQLREKLRSCHQNAYPAPTPTETSVGRLTAVYQGN